MTKPAFQINFTMPPTRGSIHRVRNFAEDLMNALEQTQSGTATDDMTATTYLTVYMASPRHLGTVRGTIRRLLIEHHLAGDAVVTRL